MDLDTLINRTMRIKGRKGRRGEDYLMVRVFGG